MDRYVNKVRVEINGQEYTDYFEVTKHGVKSRAEVELSNKVGVCDLLEVHKLTIKNALRKGAASFPWKDLDGGTLTIDYKDGRRDSFTGVTFLETGDHTMGGNEAAKYDVILLADGLQ